MPSHYSSDTAYYITIAKRGHDPRTNAKFKNEKEQKYYIEMLEGFLKDEKS